LQSGFFFILEAERKVSESQGGFLKQKESCAKRFLMDIYGPMEVDLMVGGKLLLLIVDWLSQQYF